jgi:hypothetical protein
MAQTLPSLHDAVYCATLLALDRPKNARYIHHSLLKRLPRNPDNLIDLLIPHHKLPPFLLPIRLSSIPVHICEPPPLTLVLTSGLRVERPMQPANSRTRTVNLDLLDPLKNEFRAQSAGDIIPHLCLNQAGSLFLTLLPF